MRMRSGLGRVTYTIVTICTHQKLCWPGSSIYAHIQNIQAYLTFLYIQRSRKTRSGTPV